MRNIFVFDPSLDSVLADDKNPIETLRGMGFGGEVITVNI